MDAPRRSAGSPGAGARRRPSGGGRPVRGRRAAARPATRGGVRGDRRAARGSANSASATCRSGGAEFTDDSRRMLTIISATTVLGLIGAAFTLATAIGGRVIAQRRQIGLLRAVGITPARRRAADVAHYVGLALIAAPLGAARRRADRARPGRRAPPLRRARARDPGPRRLAARAGGDARASSPWRPPCRPRRAGRISPCRGAGARARRPLRPGLAARPLGARAAPAGRGRPRRQGRVRAPRRGPRLTLGSLALAAAVLVCAMGFEATTDRVGSRRGAARPAVGPRASRRALPPERVDALLRARPDVAAVARVYETERRRRAAGVRVQLRVFDGRWGEFPFAVRDGRGVYARGRGDVGRAALEDLGVRIGGRVTLTSRGRPVTVRAVGRHVEPDNGGLEVRARRSRACPRPARARCAPPTGPCACAGGRRRAPVAARAAAGAGGRIDVDAPDRVAAAGDRASCGPSSTA